MAFGGGKLILFGEHAVVHGHPALALGLPRGVHAQARTRRGADVLAIRPWGTEVGPEGSEPLSRAFAAILETYPTERPRVRVDTAVDLPPGAGLGCSAALGVAIIRAIDENREAPRPASQVAELSLRWEQVFHGSPSGIDSTLAAQGGIGVFRRGHPWIPVAAPSTLWFVVADSGKPSSTRTMVERVERSLATERTRVEALFTRIADTTTAGAAALNEGKATQLGQLMTANQTMLRDLGVSTPSLDALCETSLRTGALGAKLTGAGGGGCVVALAADARSAEAIERALQDQTRDAFTVQVSAAGVI